MAMSSSMFSGLLVAGVNVVLLPGPGLAEFRKLHRQGEPPLGESFGEMIGYHGEEFVAGFFQLLRLAARADLEMGVDEGVVG